MTQSKPTRENPNFSLARAYEILRTLERELPITDYPVQIEVRPQMASKLGYWGRPGPGRPWHTLHISGWLDDEEMEETLRHEYAHALRGKGGHGLQWEKLARLAGCEWINVKIEPPKLIPREYLRGPWKTLRSQP